MDLDLKRVLTLALLALLPGCVSIFTVGPDYAPPDDKTPDAWSQELASGLQEGEAGLQTWWAMLEDPVLDDLIRRAREGNLDLREAVGRIREARARLGFSSGGGFPIIGALGAFERTRLSEGTIQELPPGQSRVDNFYTLGVDASWEIDLWGRIRRTIESSEASLSASMEDYRDVMVVLLRDVGTNYVEVRTLQARIEYAEANAFTQRATVQLTKDRLEAGLVPELDIRQAESNLARTESAIPGLRIQLTEAINRLSVLLGEVPGSLYGKLSRSSPVPQPPKRVLVGLPAELLRQRPDIRQAERELAAQTAQIGVAKAELYPRLTLSGTFAFEATSADLFNVGNRSWGFGPRLRWNIFDAGRIRNNIRIEDALTEQALARYEQTVLGALEEVENAMVAYVQERERRTFLAKAVEANKKSAELVETRYKAGLTDFLNVLDTQRTLAEQQDLFASSDGQVTKNLVRIYAALGGGWVIDPSGGGAPASTGTR